MIKDQPDDLDLGDETLEARQFERSQLGNAVVQLRMYYLDKLKTISKVRIRKGMRNKSKIRDF